MIELVKWDTEHFGFKVGAIEVQDVNLLDMQRLHDEAKSLEYDVIFLKTPDIIPLLSEKKCYCDERIVYKQNFINNNTINKNYNIEIQSYKQREITEDIFELALYSGAYSRYKLDSRFTVENFKTLYYDWIYNSVNSDFANDVLVYFYKEKPIGILTYDIFSTTSSIGIISVNPDYRGKSVGTKLLSHYKSLLPNSVNCLKVVTQGINLMARSFYEKNGYEIEDISYTYHYWLND